MIVTLYGAEFFAYHGFYPEEQQLGNCFVVDIEVGFTPVGSIDADELSHTVNYEQLYDIACEEMKETKKLIEAVAQAIITRIVAEFGFVNTVQVRVKKLNPMLGAKIKYSGVTVNYHKG